MQFLCEEALQQQQMFHPCRVLSPARRGSCTFAGRLVPRAASMGPVIRVGALDTSAQIRDEGQGSERPSSGIRALRRSVPQKQRYHGGYVPFCCCNSSQNRAEDQFAVLLEISSLGCRLKPQPWAAVLLQIPTSGISKSK